MTTAEHKNARYYFRQIFTCKPKNLLGLGMILLAFYFLTGKTSEKNGANDFDYLLFTQRWLPTACIQYVERSSSFSRRCTLPADFKIWAIHGLWPTKNNEMGPFFCNRSLPFDLDALRSIESDLIRYWPNIEGNREFSSLWNHEWEKHGTCAAQLPSLDTELKYFSNTLGLYRRYDIENILRGSNIVPLPGQGYSLSEMFDAFQKRLGAIPQIHCIYETHTHQPYLFEIRMCLDKNLALITCKNKNKFGRFSGLTNCPENRPIIYPITAAPPAYSKVYLEKNKGLRQKLFDLLQLVKFIQWIVS